MATNLRLPETRSRKRRRAALPALGLALVFGLAACTGGPGNEADLVKALTRDDTFTPGQAACIADSVFEEYGEDSEALEKISGAASYEDLVGTNGVEGFDEFFENTISGCTL